MAPGSPARFHDDYRVRRPLEWGRNREDARARRAVPLVAKHRLLVESRQFRSASLYAPGLPGSCLETMPTDQRVRARTPSARVLPRDLPPADCPQLIPPSSCPALHPKAATANHQAASPLFFPLLTFLWQGSRERFGSTGLFDSIRIPLAALFQFFCNAGKGLETQSGPQRFERQHFDGGNVAKIDIWSKSLDQVGLLVFERSFPDQAIDERAHTPANLRYRFSTHSAIVVVDTDTLPGFAGFNRDPLRAPFDILKRLLSQFKGSRLLCRVFLANFGDGCEPMIECATNDIATADLWQWDRPIRDLYSAETQHVGMLHKGTATTVYNCDLKQCSTWICQDATG